MLSSLIENYIMEEVKSPTPEKRFKDDFSNMLSSASRNFISDMEVTDHKHYHQLHGK